MRARSRPLHARRYFLKPRRAAGGATLHKVMRRGAGHARESLLWQLHEVLLSKSMLAHHTLHGYVSVLARC